jgi:hypothetical protein
VTGACSSGIERWHIGAFRPATAAGSWLQQAIPLEHWAAELLPLLLTFAGSNLQEADRLERLVGAAAQQAPGGGSSSSSSSHDRRCPADIQQLACQAILTQETAGRSIGAICELLETFDSAVSTGCSSSSSSASSQHASQAMQDLLQPHLLQLLQTFEAFTRSTASCGLAQPSLQAAADTSAGTVAGGDSCTFYGKHAVEWVCEYIVEVVYDASSSVFDSALDAGPGSQECQQLCSLLLSLLKASQVNSSLLRGKRLQSLLLSRLRVVAAVLQSPEQALAQPAAAPAGTPQPFTPAAAAAAAGSPLSCMLQLFGRACLQPAQHMQANEGDNCYLFIGELEDAAAACQEALMAPALSQQLSVVGCDPQQLLAHLRELLAVLQQDVGAASARTAASLTRVQRQLQATGAAFTAVPSSQMCNNPGCTCVDGSSEQGFVARRSSLCAGCRIARYCGRSCLAAHWKRHKPVCKAIAAAAAATAE